MDQLLNFLEYLIQNITNGKIHGWLWIGAITLSIVLLDKFYSRLTRKFGKFVTNFVFIVAIVGIYGCLTRLDMVKKAFQQTTEKLESFVASVS